MAQDDHGFVLFEPVLSADFTREPAGNVNTFDKIKFDPEVNYGITPCPPDYSDYNPIVSGTFGPDTPAAANINTFYRTDYVFLLSLFKFSLVDGNVYRFASEGYYTQPLFGTFTNYIKYWSPTDWGGSILNPVTGQVNTEDSGEKWCPYPYKLNEFLADYGWSGGHRGELSCNETGDWVFLFGRNPDPV